MAASVGGGAGVMRTVSPLPRSYPLSSLRCNSHCTQYRAAPGSSCNILINWQFNKYNLEVTKCFLKSHKTAVDSSYPKCGAPKFDGKLFLTLDNNILLSSPMFPHCCCPSYRGHACWWRISSSLGSRSVDCGPPASLLATLMAANLYQ